MQSKHLFVLIHIRIKDETSSLIGVCIAGIGGYLHPQLVNLIWLSSVMKH